MKQNHALRRRFLKLGAATLAVIPIMLLSGRVEAAKNTAIRSALKYQDKPEGDKKCSNCLQFVPGASPAKPGGCKIMPGDTEISPNAYCAGWVKKA